MSNQDAGSVKDTMNEYRNSTVGELQEKAIRCANELMSLRIKKKMKNLTNPNRITLVKKDLARINTVLSSKRRAAQ